MWSGASLSVAATATAFCDLPVAAYIRPPLVTAAQMTHQRNQPIGPVEGRRVTDGLGYLHR